MTRIAHESCPCVVLPMDLLFARLGNTAPSLSTTDAVTRKTLHEWSRAAACYNRQYEIDLRFGNNGCGDPFMPIVADNVVGRALTLRNRDTALGISVQRMNAHLEPFIHPPAKNDLLQYFKSY